MRLFDLDKAADVLHTILDPLASKKLIWLAWDAIFEDCDTIDIVRCKDCRYFKKYGFKLEYTECLHFDCDVSEDGYCAWGAKMEADEISNIAKESADKISKALDKVRAKGMQNQNIKEDDEP